MSTLWVRLVPRARRCRVCSLSPRERVRRRGHRRRPCFGEAPTVGETLEESSNAEETKEKAPVRLQSRRKSLVHQPSSMVVRVKVRGSRKPADQHSMVEVGSTTTTPPKKRGRPKAEWPRPVAMKLDEQSLRYESLDIRDEFVMSTEIGRKAVAEAANEDEEGLVRLATLATEDRQLVDGGLAHSASK